jgi:uncharacterized protein (UPF0333 family)
MKTDKLEKFIINHRDDFDDLTPDPKIWEKVGKGNRNARVRSIRWQRIILRVAAVLLIFIASYFFHDFLSNHKSAVKQKQQQSEVMPSGSNMARTLTEAEAFYSSQINSKKEEIFRFAGTHSEITHEVNVEFSQLDSVYTQLKRDLKDNADNQQVLEAMIQNYRIKLEILEDILNQLKMSNSSNNVKTHEIKEM